MSSRKSKHLSVFISKFVKLHFMNGFVGDLRWGWAAAGGFLVRFDDLHSDRAGLLIFV